MKFLVISDAHLIEQQGKKVAYAPYVKEMDLWMPLVDRTVFVCPNKYKGNLMAQPFKIQDFKQVGLRRLEFHTVFSAIRSFITIPYQAVALFVQMCRADHIHLRAPGNLALLACFVQILFPNKKKTAKYAGNWDPEASQPFAYRLQKRILSNTSITKNMKVLVYGNWPEQTKNVKPFFTATYTDSEKKDKLSKNFNEPLQAVFAGTLGANKRPLETIKLVESINKAGVSMQLDIYGDGPLRKDLENYIIKNKLAEIINLHGNQPADVLKKAYQKAHFTILLSQSEGWPKAIAEGMFWGCVPIATAVSCIPWMLDNGKRGILMHNVRESAISEKLISAIEDYKQLNMMSKRAQEWSQQYTMDTFEKEIKNLLS